ncbi:CheW protein [Fluviicoccus keumensis]|uniref:CheW protein n=1 Tax=Fluviicoccus keumensis TaxID=1435465 RepID=A0A4Q7ZCM1_9GAMM|nr:CheW domain-containing protein [Fluviicoccus keumensis]RZU47735.1 CheW protein [Fluviicoccus keumensis]
MDDGSDNAGGTASHGRIQASTLMPEGRRREILRERARLLARRPEPLREEMESESFIAVRIGPAGRYGVPYRCIEEIVVMPEVTPVPCTPPAFAGVVNYRGELLSVLNLKAFFHRDPEPPGRNIGIVVLRSGRGMAGLWVDEVLGNDTFEPGRLASFQAGPGHAGHHLILGVHAGHVCMLNVVAMLESPLLQVNEVLES